MKLYRQSISVCFHLGGILMKEHNTSVMSSSQCMAKLGAEGISGLTEAQEKAAM